MLKKLKSIGILGGSFDPPHKGHLYISNQSLKILKLSKIFWIITNRNPFKKNPFFSLSKRKKMCKKIAKKNSNISVKYLEKKLKSKSSFRIVNYFKKKGNLSIFFIIGSDNLINFHKWKNYKKLINLCYLVVFSRKGFDKKARISVIMKSKERKKIIFIKNKKMDVSSSKLKAKITNGS